MKRNNDRADRTDVEDLRLVGNAVALLAEHFETVQVFCTRHLGEAGTVQVNRGAGNWYARRGQIRDWMLQQDADEFTRVSKRVEEEEEEEEDG